MEAYIKKNRLKGKLWETPTMADAEEIVQILQHKESRTGLQMKTMWDNGATCWTSLENALADAKELVRDYWESIGVHLGSGDINDYT